MSANGTPQSYLAKFRQNTSASNYRDPSMDQNNTGSGNPYGYYDPGSQAPTNRYIPPSFNGNTGQWDTSGLTYSLPTAYTPNGGGGMPTGPTRMPNLYGAPRGFQGTTQQPAQQQAQPAAPGGAPMPNFVQPPASSGPAQPGNGNGPLTPAQQNAVAGNGLMPSGYPQPFSNSAPVPAAQGMASDYTQSASTNAASIPAAQAAAPSSAPMPNFVNAPQTPGTAQPASSPQMNDIRQRMRDAYLPRYAGYGSERLNTLIRNR